MREMLRRVTCVTLLAALGGCAPAIMGTKPKELTIEKAMEQLACSLRGFRDAKDANGEFKLGLVTSDVDVNFQVEASANDSLKISAGAKGESVSASAGYELATAARRGNTINIKLTNLLALHQNQIAGNATNYKALMDISGDSDIFPFPVDFQTADRGRAGNKDSPCYLLPSGLYGLQGRSPALIAHNQYGAPVTIQQPHQKPPSTECVKANELAQVQRIYLLSHKNEWGGCNAGKVNFENELTSILQKHGPLTTTEFSTASNTIACIYSEHIRNKAAQGQITERDLNQFNIDKRITFNIYKFVRAQRAKWSTEPNSGGLDAYIEKCAQDKVELRALGESKFKESSVEYGRAKQALDICEGGIFSCKDDKTKLEEFKRRGRELCGTDGLYSKYKMTKKGLFTFYQDDNSENSQSRLIHDEGTCKDFFDRDRVSNTPCTDNQSATNGNASTQTSDLEIQQNDLRACFGKLRDYREKFLKTENADEQKQYLDHIKEIVVKLEGKDGWEKRLSRTPKYNWNSARRACESELFSAMRREAELRPSLATEEPEGFDQTLYRRYLPIFLTQEARSAVRVEANDLYLNGHTSLRSDDPCSPSRETEAEVDMDERQFSVILAPVGEGRDFRMTMPRGTKTFSTPWGPARTVEGP